MKAGYTIWILGLLLAISCSEEKVTNPHAENIIVLGHTYQWHADGTKIDHRIADVDFSQYRGVWLGGDMCSETTRHQSTLDYLDSIFKLSHVSTL